MWAREGGLGMALLAWLTAVSPAINMDGCDLLRHRDIGHFQLSSAMLLGFLGACNTPCSFSLKLSVSLSLLLARLGYKLKTQKGKTQALTLLVRGCGLKTQDQGSGLDPGK